MQNLSREELLKRLSEVGFAGVDLNLYLDTHPYDENALRDYNAIVQELRQLMNCWEMNYGPLMDHGMSPSQYPWQWVDEPWPWERDF